MLLAINIWNLRHMPSHIPRSAPRMASTMSVGRFPETKRAAMRIKLGRATKKRLKIGTGISGMQHDSTGFGKCPILIHLMAIWNISNRYPLVMTFTVRHGKIHHAFLSSVNHLFLCTIWLFYVELPSGYLTVRHGNPHF